MWGRLTKQKTKEVRMKTIAIFIPAWNEEKGVGRTIESIRAQVLKHNVIVSNILVLANNCTDNTVAVAEQYMDDSEAPVYVIDLPVCPGKKAGAMNFGYAWLLANNAVPTFVYTMDADTVLEEGALQGLVDAFSEFRSAGAVCSRYMPFERDTLCQRLQALEYARFDDARRLRDWKVQVASGASVMYRSSVLAKVVSAHGTPWRENSLIEDYGLTLDIKAIGYSVYCAEKSMVLTDTPATFRELWKQRSRWTRGGVDEVRRYGWTPWTRRDLVGYAWFGINILSRVLFAYLLTIMILFGGLSWSLLGALPQVLFIVNRLTSVYSLKNKSVKERVLLFTVLPEDFYGMWMELLTLSAILKAFGDHRKTQQW